ncbi:hypothetical protein VE03_10225, partial [Pseudogymnoascus sp. 23342-1-I1]
MSAESGEHKQNPDEDRSTKTLVQLAGYSREVFGSQPDRRFVPGFTICGSVMRLWVFDRSGPYSSEKFDIHKELEQIIQIIAGYTLMMDAELGLNTFIRREQHAIEEGTRTELSSDKDDGLFVGADSKSEPEIEEEDSDASDSVTNFIEKAESVRFDGIQALEMLHRLHMVDYGSWREGSKAANDSCEYHPLFLDYICIVGRPLKAIT